MLKFLQVKPISLKAGTNRFQETPLDFRIVTPHLRLTVAFDIISGFVVYPPTLNPFSVLDYSNI